MEGVSGYKRARQFVLEHLDLDVARESRWKRARSGRISLAFGDRNTISLTDALNQSVSLTDREIWVVNYDSGEFSREEEKQYDKVEADWEAGKQTPPAAIREKIQFDCISAFTEGSGLKKYYHWNSWVVDLTDSKPRFWYVADEERKLFNRKSNSYTVPLYGAKEIPLDSAVSIRMTTGDLAELRRRWKKRVGERHLKWEPLEKFAGGV